MLAQFTYISIEMYILPFSSIKKRNLGIPIFNVHIRWRKRKREKGKNEKQLTEKENQEEKGL